MGAGPLAAALAGGVSEEEGVELTEEATNAVLGYPIDKFQQDCLKVIVDPRMDLLAMAPTGSGKTAVALMAILQAFARGKKAIYTSPIKALSNDTRFRTGSGVGASRRTSACSRATSRFAPLPGRATSCSSARAKFCGTSS